MKAVLIRKGGGPEVLQIQEVEMPSPKEGEVLIQIKAAGVNRSDIFTRENPDAYGSDLKSASIPGLEVSGIIVDLGNSASKFKKAD